MGRVVNDGVHEIYEEEQTEEQFISEVTANNGKVHIVSLTMRPGSLAFAALIEYHQYPPSNQALNDEFEVRSRDWEDMMFNVISFPLFGKGDAQAVAVHLGLRIVDGVPTILSSDPNDPILMRLGEDVVRGKHFPGGVLPNGEDNRRMFTLESNTKGMGEGAAQTKLTNEQVFRREAQMIDKFAEGVMLRPREAAHFIFGTNDFADERYVQYFLNMSHEELVRLQARRSVLMSRGRNGDV